ncbi:MAG: FG-GAP-like repeat-containing protein [Myxococcota bacterium]
MRGVTCLLLLSTVGCVYTFEKFPAHLGEGDVTGVVTGVLPGETGAPHPLAGVRVTLRGSTLNRKSRADGRFTLRNLPTGVHHITLSYDANDDGLPELARRIQVSIQPPPGRSARPSVDLGNIALVAPGRIRCVVQGNAEPGSTVVALLDGSTVVPSGGDGSFLTAPLAPGSWTVVAGAREQTTGALLLSPPTTVVVDENLTTEATLVLGALEGERRVTGRVVLPEGNAGGALGVVHQALVSMTYKFTSLVPGFDAVTRADDEEYDFLLPVGLYLAEITADEGGYLPLRILGFLVNSDGGGGNFLFLPDEVERDGPCAGRTDLDGDGLCFVDPAEAEQCIHVCRQTGRNLGEPCQWNNVPVDCDDDNDGQADLEEALGSVSFDPPCHCGPTGALPASPTCENDPTRADRDFDGICDVSDPYPTCRYNRAPCAGICGDGIIDLGEECDDGNTVEDETCFADCTLPSITFAPYKESPSAAVAGVPFTVLVRMDDAVTGERATWYRGTITVTSNDPHAQLPPPHTFTADDNAEHVFTVELRTAGRFFVHLVDLDHAVDVGSSVDVSAGEAAVLLLEVPDVVGAGQPNDVMVTAHDAFGNHATSYRGTVALSSSDNAAAVSATHTFDGVDAGYFLFAGALTLVTPGDQTVTADDIVNGLSASASVRVGPGLTTRFLLTMPDSVRAGEAHDLVVTALDDYDNVTPGYAGTVQVLSADTTGNVPADHSFQPAVDSGEHTFSGGVVMRRTGAWEVVVQDAVIPSIRGTHTVEVTAAEPAQLVFTQQPQDGVALVPMDVTVTARDLFDNEAPTSDAFHLELVGPDPARLRGQTLLTPPANTGSATFSVSVSEPGIFQLRVLLSGVAPTESNLFTVVLGVPAVSGVDVDPVAGGCVEVRYNLAQPASRTVDVVVEWSLDGSTFFPATQAPAHSGFHGVSGVPGTPGGVARTFLWNSTRDLRGSRASTAQVRVLSRLRDVESGWVTSNTFTVGNDVNLVPEYFVPNLDVTDVAVAELDGDGTPEIAALLPGAVRIYERESPGFNERTVDLSGHDLVGVEAADMDHDGDVDLLVGANESSEVLLLENVGDGTFAAPLSLAMSPGAGVAALRVGDVDGDGWPDVVVATAAGALVWRVSSRTPGVYAAFVSASLRASASGLELADLDDDGAVDALIFGGTDPNVTLAAGPNFQAGVPLGETGVVSLVVAADVDRDSVVDVVVASDAGTAVFHGQGAFSFGARVAITTALAPIAVLDLDDDGWLDLVANDTVDLVRLWGPLDGTSTPETVVVPDAPGVMTPADIDGDGSTDLAVGHVDATHVTLLLNQRFRACAPSLQPAPHVVRVSDAATALAVMDYNLDGKPDVLTGGAAGSVDALRGLGDGALYPDGSHVRGAVKQLEALAVRADGKAELAAGLTNGDVEVHVWDAGTLRPSAIMASNAIAFTSGDFNLDGEMDILVRKADTLELVRGPRPYQRDVVRTGLAGTATQMLSADLDGDGLLDAIVVDGVAGNVQLYWGDGHGGFTGPTESAEPGVHGVVVVGFTLDALPDLAILRADGLHFRENLGARAFQPRVIAPVLPNTTLATTLGGAVAVAAPGGSVVRVVRPGLADSYSSSDVDVIEAIGALASADLDADGAADLVVGHANVDRTVAVVPSVEMGALPDAVVPVASAVVGLVVTDVDHDGAHDVVTADQGAVALYYGDGSATVSYGLDIDVTTGVRALAHGDFNRDGIDDFVTSVDQDPLFEVRFHLSNGESWTPMGYSLLVSPGQLDVGDVDNNGYLDVVTTAGDKVHLLLGDGESFAPVDIPTACNLVTAVALADFNRDGWLDLVIGCDSAEVAVLTLVPGAPGDLPSASFHPAGLIPRRVFAADLDHDGDNDVVLAGENVTPGGEGQVQTWFGEGAGTLLQGPVLPISPLDLVVMDWNDDGMADVIATETTARVVSLHLGDGTGNFNLLQRRGLPGYGAHVAVGDLLSDGRADLALGVRDPNNMLVLLTTH